MNENTALLEFEQFTISLDIAGSSTPLVNGVDLTVRRREVLALVGESGSGKTLSSRSILQLLPDGATTTGTVVLDGTDVLTVTGRERQELRGGAAAMIFQEPSAALYPVFTIGWQFEEGLKAHGVARKERRKQAVELLAAVGIDEPERRLRQYPHEFSGGQKQRIVIAMALAARPKLLIADEPTTALDVTVQAEILDLLRRCRDDFGTAILLVTHNMGVVADIADRVAVMRDGSIVETGPVDEIFYRPTHPYTRQLLDAVPRFQSQVQSASDAPDPVGQITSRPGDGTAPYVEDAAVTALSVRDLSITYPGTLGRPSHQAVSDVSFDIAAGEVLALVGESGSGKSTIGKAIVGLAPATGGSVELLGTDLRALRGRARRASLRRVGIVFQDPVASFNPHLTVAECIVEGMVIQRIGEPRARRQRAQELLDAVRLPASFADRHPAQLSGGQRQRVGIARALATRPELVIADEPTSALDVSVQAEVLEMFVELQRDLGFACLFITHDLAVVEDLADRVAVLRAGRLVELGATETVMTRPREAYTQRLIAAVPVPDPIAQERRRTAYRERYLSTDSA